MGFVTNNSNANRNTNKKADVMSAHVTGEITDIYVGKKSAYVTIKCVKDNGYYNEIKVAYPLDYNGADLSNGSKVNIVAVIDRFYDRNKQCFIITFTWMKDINESEDVPF